MALGVDSTQIGTSEGASFQGFKNTQLETARSTDFSCSPA